MDALSGWRWREEGERLPVGNKERWRTAPPPAHGRTWKLCHTWQLWPLPLPVLSPVYSLLYMDGEGLGNGGAYSMRCSEAR